jgi:hypothetical protein
MQKEKVVEKKKKPALENCPPGQAQHFFSRRANEGRCRVLGELEEPILAPFCIS